MRIVLACPLLALSLALAQPAFSRVDPVVMAQATTTAERAHLILDDALKARNPDTRKVAVQSLGLIGSREPYVSQLKTMLQDKDVQVRIAVVASLLDLKDNDTVPNLRIALSDPVPEVRFAAAKALWTLGDAEGRDALVSVLAGDTPATSGYFATEGRDALRLFYAPGTAIPYLVGRTIGFAHVAGLGLGVASLEGLLSDRNMSSRAAAALLLSKDQDPKVLLAMREALADKDESVRAAAIHAIALRDDPKLEIELLPFLEDKAEAVSTRAAAGCLRLELIQPPVVAPVPNPQKGHPHG
jgi:HEAT repeat protein